MKSRSLVYTALVLFSFAFATDEQGLAAIESGRAQFSAAQGFALDAAADPDAGLFFGAIGEAMQIIHSTRHMAFRPYGNLHDSRVEAADVPGRVADIVAKASAAHGVDPRLIAAVALNESRWDSTLVSSAGAAGVMQLMPETARLFGVSNVFDDRENIAAGTRYLRNLLDRYDGDLDLALAAYNAGPTAVARYRGIPPYGETQAYVRNVKATYAAFRARTSL